MLQLLHGRGTLYRHESLHRRSAVWSEELKSNDDVMMNPSRIFIQVHFNLPLFSPIPAANLALWLVIQVYLLQTNCAFLVLHTTKHHTANGGTYGYSIIHGRTSILGVTHWSRISNKKTDFQLSSWDQTASSSIFTTQQKSETQNHNQPLIQYLLCYLKFS